MRREEPRDPVTKFSGQAASVHIRQAERSRVCRVWIIPRGPKHIHTHLIVRMGRLVI